MSKAIKRETYNFGVCNSTLGSKGKGDICEF